MIRRLSAENPLWAATRFLIRNRDRIYGDEVVETMKAMGIEPKIIGYESPGHDGYCKRVIGSIRRECLDHMIMFSGGMTGSHRGFAEQPVAGFPIYD